MKYVDGFVLTIPKGKVEAYKKMAEEASKVWKKHGALEYFECVGDDMSPNMKGVTLRKFPEMAKAGKNDVVIFAFIIYNSRKHRDEVNKKVMAEMEEYHKKNPDHMKDMPFDVEKMAYGGFQTIVEQRRGK